jgi:hypothetical protein
MDYTISRRWLVPSNASDACGRIPCFIASATYPSAKVIPSNVSLADRSWSATERSWGGIDRLWSAADRSWSGAGRSWSDAARLQYYNNLRTNKLVRCDFLPLSQRRLLRDRAAAPVRVADKKGHHERDHNQAGDQQQRVAVGHDRGF